MKRHPCKGDWEGVSGGYSLEVLQSLVSIGHFRVAVNHIMKARLSAKLFI